MGVVFKIIVTIIIICITSEQMPCVLIVNGSEVNVNGVKSNSYDRRQHNKCFVKMQNSEEPLEHLKGRFERSQNLRQTGSTNNKINTNRNKNQTHNSADQKSGFVNIMLSRVDLITGSSSYNFGKIEKDNSGNQSGFTRYRKLQNCSHNNLPAVVNLIKFISKEYYKNCATVMLYDEYYAKFHRLMTPLIKEHPHSFLHGATQKHNFSKIHDKTCRHFILFLRNLHETTTVVGDLVFSYVAVVTDVSKWKVKEFLQSASSRKVINLIVIRTDDILQQEANNQEILMYTHELFVDGLGASRLQVLTAWRCERLTRPQVNLFPEKLKSGFKGHQFVISTGYQPPFVVQRGFYIDGPKRIPIWDGLEIRLLYLLSEVLDFTMTFIQNDDARYIARASNAVVKDLKEGRADIGVAGIYVTPERNKVITLSSAHSQDYATFLTITSTALPRYQAIMGPFQWTVWLALTLTYLLAIFPISFSDRHSLMHLLKDPWQVENMFWYVFGTFTNCFTFKGKDSWTNSKKAATRMLIGWYWAFSIIISACYTGCIIAFVTLPVYPARIDNLKQVIGHRMHVGTLSEGGWRYWFNDSADPLTTELFEKMEYLPDLETAMFNVTQAYYRDYAFFGSFAQLEYIVQINYTQRSQRKTYLYLANEELVPFSVSLAFPYQAPHSNIMNQKILRAVQSGLITKLKRDLEWDLQRSSSGKFLAAVSSAFKPTKMRERKLTLEDVTGMFLLMGAGYGLGAAILTIETISWLIKLVNRKCLNGKNPEDARQTSERYNDQQAGPAFMQIESTNTRYAQRSFTEHSPYNLEYLQNELVPRRRYRDSISLNRSVRDNSIPNRAHVEDAECSVAVDYFGGMVQPCVSRQHGYHDSISLQLVPLKENTDENRAFTF
ncbi:Ionotropic receptor 21a [Blattella germanica]|nr:Ionotropic receptor 21a [Blattella germanica]